ncbi:sulfurtransferase TusA family protein [Paenibacillus doosanensis]|uniref:sulfurtransferase TusA family protein n=1 Tax=Paenibacillus doosanensis TaxID=1229154 RepID=UPI002180205A|nr:sulfurtransferase TusA family protein [Paenibacillus doosanensis]MCS7461726.1 sulfurtransferase TusA family protein [Paenibacillus doosanensis]
MNTRIIDAKGLACPMPIVKAKKAIDAMESGQMMELLTTDQGSLNDVQAWVKRTGHELVEIREEQGAYSFRIQKK